MRERDIERYLAKRVKEIGGECRKVQWIGRRGAPDRLVMLPGPWAGFGSDGSFWVSPRTIWVELKAPFVRPPAYQLREHERMRKMGQQVVVIDSIEGVEELLR